jgi:hypothetical protein
VVGACERRVSGGPDACRVVLKQTAIDSLALERLVAEIETYLAVVDAFRREGVDPRWVPEGVESLPSEEV